MDCCGSVITFYEFLADQGPLLIKQSKRKVLLLLFKMLLGLWCSSPILVYSEKFLSFDLDFLTWYYYVINLLFGENHVICET